MKVKVKHIHTQILLINLRQTGYKLLGHSYTLATKLSRLEVRRIFFQSASSQTVEPTDELRHIHHIHCVTFTKTQQRAPHTFGWAAITLDRSTF